MFFLPFLYRDEVLPLVHQSWKPLKLLFNCDNLFVVAKAFHVLRVIGQVAKDFIHRRALSDVFPSVARYITKLQVATKPPSSSLLTVVVT